MVKLVKLMFSIVFHRHVRRAHVICQSGLSELASEAAIDFTWVRFHPLLKRRIEVTTVLGAGNWSRETAGNKNLVV